MSAYMLVVVLFVSMGNPLAKVIPVSSADACEDAGKQITGDLQGADFDPKNGQEPIHVLDAQYVCLPFEQGRHA